jgi:beta-lactamase superfamily II metal-dependent hydrolase
MPVDEDRPDATEIPLRPWTPPCVPAELLTDTSQLSYIVVDEIVGNTVTLTVSVWPGSDERGRVRFPAGEEDSTRGHVLVHLKELRERLYEGWLRRAPRVGDAFAAVLGDAVAQRLRESGEVVLDRGTRLADALPGPIADLTAEARNVAKLAFFAAVAGVQPHEQAEELGQAQKAARMQKTSDGEVPRVGRVKAAPWKGDVLTADDGAAPESRHRWTVPKKLWPAPGGTDLLTAIEDEPTALVYFLLNIGDGDAQVLLLPKDPGENGRRRAIVVDAGATGKPLHLMSALAEAGAMYAAKPPAQALALVVATHPHDDHIEGLAEIVQTYGGIGVGDFWEPGFYAPTRAFAELMAEVEDAAIPHCEPAAGMVRYVGGVKITVLAPSVRLRTAYDTYGVDCNDASIVLKIEFPAVRISTGEVDGREKRRDLKLSDPWSIILGADAQTRSWANVTAEFAQLTRGTDSEIFRALRKAGGRDDLAAHILKVSHHASKHGINIELIERVHPRISLISSVGGGGKYGFPHALATQAIAEALSPSTRAGSVQPEDADLGIHYTGGLTEDGRPLGSIAMVVPAKVGGRLRMWRFGDGPRDDLDLAAAKLLDPLYRSRQKRTPVGSNA